MCQCLYLARIPEYFNAACKICSQREYYAALCGVAPLLGGLSLVTEMTGRVKCSGIPTRPVSQIKRSQFLLPGPVLLSLYKMMKLLLVVMLIVSATSKTNMFGDYCDCEYFSGGCMVRKILQNAFRDHCFQGCRIVLGAWQQKICAWQKIA